MQLKNAPVFHTSAQLKVGHLQEELTTLRGWGKEQKEAQIDQVKFCCCRPSYGSGFESRVNIRSYEILQPFPLLAMLQRHIAVDEVVNSSAPWRETSGHHILVPRDCLRTAEPRQSLWLWRFPEQCNGQLSRTSPPF